MPDVDEAEANGLMERIQSLVVMNNKYYRDPELSLSTGASTSKPGFPHQRTISLADDAMYRNKGMYHHRRKEDR
jgi:GGDEF domain-containing protein